MFVEGMWGTWSSWSTCDPATLSQVRTRQCSNPSPAYGGNPCLGLPNATQDCIPPCRGKLWLKGFLFETSIILCSSKTLILLGVNFISNGLPRDNNCQF